MNEPIAINLLLMLQDQTNATELGPALRAALREVELFYNHVQQRSIFRRLVSEEVVASRPLKDTTAVTGEVTGAILKMFARDPKGISEGASGEEAIDAPWMSVHTFAEGKFSGTYEADKIAIVAEQSLRDKGYGGKTVVVTDLQLSPPPDRRYILWDKQVISIIHMDPEYWWMGDSTDRVAVVKHRARAACLANVGILLGLEPCDNERCFLYGGVESVRCLDAMVTLGQEHKEEGYLAAITGWGFDARSDNPGAVQPIVEHPTPDMEY